MKIILCLVNEVINLSETYQHFPKVPCKKYVDDDYCVK